MQKQKKQKKKKKKILLKNLKNALKKKNKNYFHFRRKRGHCNPNGSLEGGGKGHFIN
jgi:hypothetical protein